jgi:aspartyl-tRNA(Asn)/glutamyl-tRNA(Gln) amidotransferase subunit A
LTDPVDLSIPEAAAALRAGTLTARNLTEAVLARIVVRNPKLHAFTHLAGDAQEQADRADAMLASGQDPGPFCGIPVAVKDLIDCAGQPATSGSRVLAGRVADADADAVARLRAQGAVLIGKLATYEFAMVGPDLALADPPARNPWNTDHITGGSSSGSAAAVAGGMVRMAIGTDTGGSIRSPAAYCGCVGLKPSYCRVSRNGAFPLSPSLDHVGPLAATVAEAALALDAMTKSPEQWRPAASLLSRGLSGLRIGFARDWFADDPQASPALVAAMDAAAAQFSLLGAVIELVTLPSYDIFEAAGSVILHAEALEQHRGLMRDHAADYGRPVLQSLAFGAAIDAGDLARARVAQGRLATAMQRAMAGVDLVIAPTTLTPAPPFAAFDGETAVWTPMRTIPFNVTGQPALSLPIGFDHGLPLGMQIIGRMGDEDLICAAGHAFEQGTDHSALRPVVLGQRVP